MNLNQMRFVREAVRQNFNLSAAANALFTSQPGVSKAIIELEQQLGIEIFVRHGKRIKGLTEPGRAVLPIIERLLIEAESLKRVGEEYAAQDSGNLIIATTHTQARYTLPRVIQEFRLRFPRVRLSLLQGSPAQLAEMVLQGEADLAVATETIATREGLVSIPCFQWEHVVLTLPDHPMARHADRTERPLTLEELADYPIVTYDAAYAGRARIDAAFHKRNLAPDVVLAAIDADVIKTYVETGLGVGILAAMAFDPQRDTMLRAIPAGHLFGHNTTHLAVRRGSYLRGYVYTFMELLAHNMDRKMLERLLHADPAAPSVASSYQL